MWRSLCEKACILWKGWRKKDFVIWFGMSVMLAFFFYRNGMGLFVTLPAAHFLIFITKGAETIGRIRTEREQFKECIHSVAASLRAGYAPVGAFAESRKDMVMMYGIDSEIVRRLDGIQIGIKNNQSLEELLLQWGSDSDAEEVSEFAEVFAIAKRSGGSVLGVIENTALMIQNRMEAEREIETLLSNKRMEQKVMSAMPFLLVLYLQLGNPGYFDVLYGNAFGVAVMTVMLGVFLWSQYYFAKVLEGVFG